VYSRSAHDAGIPRKKICYEAGAEGVIVDLNIGAGRLPDESGLRMASARARAEDTLDQADYFTGGGAFGPSDASGAHDAEIAAYFSFSAVISATSPLLIAASKLARIAESSAAHGLSFAG